MKKSFLNSSQSVAGEDLHLVRGSGIRGRIFLGTFALATLVGGFGGWAATSELAGAVIGHGQVKVDKDLRSVQHLDGGIIRDIAAKKGDEVKEGQVLIALDDTALSSELSIAKGQLVELSAKRLRLMAERDGADAMPEPAASDPEGLTNSAELANETRLFHNNRETRVHRIEQMKLTVAQIDEELRGLDAQMKSNLRETELVQEEYDRVEALKKQGLTDTGRVFSFSRDLARLLGDKNQIESNTARAQAHRNEIEVQILGIDDGARTDAQKELADIEPRIEETRQRIAATTARLSRLVIRSPISGYVNEIFVNTVGGIVTPAQKLITIVPQDAALEVETHIQPTDIDQVYVGQDTKLKFTAFNSRTTPELKGHISFISPATTVEQSTGRAYYVAQVDVPADQYAKLEGKKMVPGMPVEVFIQTESRTALSYLVRPVYDQLSRAFTEN
ncbi:HlyD family type I secretion periplasmic adaptor subunit [Aestuariivirga sp.]|uniref:HlyD family type I secretion periplasmic adaptor subunit n=1 Tax=Aestuariivirga sp. TaxID=2650926 RepID=UPI0039E296F4